METMNVALPDSLKEFVHKRVADGGYSTVSEYIRGLIRTDQKTLAREQLEAELMKGIQSGPATDMTPDDWEQLRTKLRERVEKR